MPRTENLDCATCGMHVGAAAEYHPHLFCVLWRAYHQDPAEVLAEHGYTRAGAPDPGTEGEEG